MIIPIELHDKNSVKWKTNLLVLTPLLHSEWIVQQSADCHSLSLNGQHVFFCDFDKPVQFQKQSTSALSNHFNGTAIQFKHKMQTENQSATSFCCDLLSFYYYP